MSEWIHAIQEWLIQYGSAGLFIVSFFESSFFPIPPDFFLIALGMADPSKALWYAFLTTSGSVLGAIFGWYIGKKLGRPVLRYIIKEERIQIVENYFQKYGSMAILIAGFTPIPYKVFTIFSGISKMNLRVLIFWSIIGRGARFFMVGLIIVILGDQAKTFIENNFGLLTVLGGLIILIAYLIYVVIRKRKSNIV